MYQDPKQALLSSSLRAAGEVAIGGDIALEVELVTAASQGTRSTATARCAPCRTEQARQCLETRLYL